MRTNPLVTFLQKYQGELLKMNPATWRKVQDWLDENPHLNEAVGGMQIELQERMESDLILVEGDRFKVKL